MKNRRNIAACAVLFIAIFLCFCSSTAEANALSAAFKSLPYSGDILRGIFKSGDDASKAVKKYGGHTIGIAEHYGDDAAKLIIRNTDDRVKIADKILPPAVKPEDSIAGFIAKEATKPKTILAVGSSVSVATPLYQLSKGYREAKVTAAEKDPSIMAGGILGFLTTPFKNGLNILLCGFAIIVLFFTYIYAKLKFLKK